MLRRHSVERMTGLSKSTLYRLIKQGHFPPPLRLTRKAVRWRSAEIQEWLSDRPRGGGRDY
ncbi:MAG: AlpA family phage regulatory protein [Gammaproteobacteria bacterium]|nr:AlpA family phage regulatory protein [Gammaproteobacteria bacterium]